MNRRHRRQSGLSLVELLVAVTLSLILALGIIQIFSSSKQTSRVQNELARLQENARFALDILGRDIRMAGQLGCNSAVTVSDASNGTLAPYDQGIIAHHGNETVEMLNNAGELSDVADDSSVILVTSADADSVMADASGNAVQVADAALLAGISAGDPLLISDCDSAHQVIVAAVSGSSLTLTGTLDKTYQNAELARLNHVAYYLRDSNGRRNLYRSYVNGISGAASVTTDPLLEGVEAFQIVFGQDVNGDGERIRYVDSDQVDDPVDPQLDWNRVASARIHLLLATENNLAEAPQSYWFTDELVEPGDNDRRLFRSFTTTVQLRNQGIDA